ncbi:MAG: hypothetical protein ABI818_02705 [Acidobacteriota bacterium]
MSTGRLKSPEELEPGNIQRTTASASWTKQSGADMTAATVAYGVNRTDLGTRHALLAEITRRRGAMTGFGRFELLQPETAALLHASSSNHAEPGNERPAVAAFNPSGEFQWSPPPIWSRR